MGFGGLGRIAAAIAALWLLFAGAAARAEAPAPAFAAVPASICQAAALPGETYAELSRRPERWKCGAERFSIEPERSFLKIVPSHPLQTAETGFTTRLSRFAGLQLIAIGTDGRMAVRDLTESDMVPGSADWVMSAALPPLEAPLAALVVRVDKPRHLGMLSDARLTVTPGERGGPFQNELVIAALCGMLCMTLLFNFIFYRILGARFLVWHAMAVLCMLIHTAITSGVVNRFLSLSLGQLSTMSAVSFWLGLSAAALFSADLMEPGKLDKIHRTLLRGVGIWVMLSTGFYLLADGPLRSVSATVYFAAYVPVLAVFIWIMGVAKHRGSRAVNFQIVAWLPFMLTGAARIFSMLGFTEVPIEFHAEQHVSIAFEVIVATMSVADRLMIIREERDWARAQTRVLAAQAERDPLTGMLNRYGIEKRFEELYAAGFHAMAVIDVDHFKAINDTHGHATGDEVLRAVADALAPDEETVAVRIGGEEFMLLMGGKDVAGRAERCRQAIPARVASRVPGLDRMVTASMGLVEQPLDIATGDFAGMYAHCDRLLYDAKAAGRNRAMCEKMCSFAPARKAARV
ncbi:diguanylate cyclase [Tsuneonella sp. CC-YZS046]|uniref:sensor domain-containing diguanylate cyclase n=1 Tax=Tsuneonella sp. CC-YZS046 TaxID=3042152 RepID=UPI002D79CF41|nr:diguanylate cyclase [Tsuneonella sp. CC-YZS046]WRO66427.1 diguanylate cyclase [Tsuneonella sp. CC-YZS046]